MIIDAVIPLLVENGRAVTTRQIAEAAGVAEGTIFRAFGDKESLLQAAIDHYFDPEPLRASLRALPRDITLETKVRMIVALMLARFRDIIRLAAALGQGSRRRPESGDTFSGIISDLLRPELDGLDWPPHQVAHVIRMVTFAAAFPALNDGVEFDEAELARVILYGIAGRPTTE